MCEKSRVPFFACLQSLPYIPQEQEPIPRWHQQRERTPEHNLQDQPHETREPRHGDVHRRQDGGTQGVGVVRVLQGRPGQRTAGLERDWVVHRRLAWAQGHGSAGKAAFLGDGGGSSSDRYGRV